MKHILLGGCLTALLTVQAASVGAQDTQLLWGDTHLHSSYSTDAFMAGNRSADPDTAYRLAKGEPVVHPFTRTRVQLTRPLDFLVVADHAESLGVLKSIYANNPDQSELYFWQRWRSAFYLNRFRAMIENPAEGTAAFLKRLPPVEVQPGDKVDPIEFGSAEKANLGFSTIISQNANDVVTSIMWEDSVTSAERHNNPGTFSAIIGWEWTQTNNGANLHRVVLSTLDGPTAATIDPVGSDDASHPEDLWAGLAKLETKTGAQFMSIPHNSNISKGFMFGETTIRGEEITAQYATTRAEWEPLTEATQFKGDSETHPDLSPEDEFADFERFEFYLQRAPNNLGYKAGKGDFVRSALKRGLEIEQRIGVNPYKFGLIGSTDAHTSIASAEEPNFWGKVALDSIPENKRTLSVDDGNNYISGKDNFNGWTMSASGMAAVWATENTRQSIFDAMKRKETYATTGPRMSVRLFGGWNFDDGALNANNIAEIGYASGVPMGGDLTAAPEGAAPQFLVRAVKDPLNANLDRVQIIKGWVDTSGVAQEKIYDIAWSDDRVVGADGKLPAVGNTVDIKSGLVENTIGAPELTTVWSDPEFDASQRAFYYVRVLQIPTIRHSQLDAIALDMKETPYEGPATIQERAYSSPIWYTP